MNDGITYVGIDAHKRDLFIAMLGEDGRSPTTWQVANQLVHQLDRVEAVGLRAAPPAIYLDARRIEHEIVAAAVAHGSEATGHCDGGAPLSRRHGIGVTPLTGLLSRVSLDRSGLNLRANPSVRSDRRMVPRLSRMGNEARPRLNRFIRYRWATAAVLGGDFRIDHRGGVRSAAAESDI